MGIVNENGIAKLAALASASYARIYHTHDYVKNITTGLENGTINYTVGFDTFNVPIKGLKSAAYTESSEYAAYSHTHDPSEIRLVHYVMATEPSAITDEDTVFTAIGKLEALVNTKSPIGHIHSSNNITSLENYSKPEETSALSVNDTLNEALGKLEKALDTKQGVGNYLYDDEVAIDSYMLGGIEADAYALKTDLPVIPTEISAFNNDVGYITGISWNDVTDKPTNFASTQHVHGSDDINVLTDYVKPDTTSAIEDSDTLNEALGKLEAALDTKQNTGDYLTPESVLDATKLSGTIPEECYTDTVYIHPTTPGNKHIPSGGEEGQILRWSADGVATWGNDYNTQYTASDGIALENGNFINSGVRDISTGTTNGTINVNVNGVVSDISVYGLGSAAFTESTDYLDVNGVAVDSNKLGNIEASNYALKTDIPTDISSFANDVGYITGIAWDDVTDKPEDFTPSAHTQDSSTITALTDYAKADMISAIEVTDTLNEALGKLEKALDGKQEAGAYLTAASTLNASNLFGTIPAECYTDTIYVHPTTPGNKHIPEGGSEGQILQYSDDGTAAWTDPDRFVMIDTAQNISGEKTFVGQTRIKFKQAASNDKLGFTLYTKNDIEKGSLEYNPQNLIDNVPLMALGNYASTTDGLTHIGFRKYSSIENADGAYNLLTPLISDAKEPFDLTTTYTNFYFPLGITNGSSMVLTNKNGVLNISPIIDDLAEVYAPLNSPTLTGIPTAPTAEPGTNTDQIATTAFVLEAANSAAGGAHTHSTNNIIALTEYEKPEITSALETTDSLNSALGKLERAIDDKQDALDEFTAEEILVLWNTYFGVPVTVMIIQSTGQTITVTVDGVDHTETFTAPTGTEYTVTITPDIGYVAGTLSNTSGTLERNIAISATEATVQTFTLTLPATENQTITLEYEEPDEG